MSAATRMGNRATLRVHIDEAIVGEALYLASAAKDSNEVHDYADTEQRYLVLRQRGSRVGWFVRARPRMKRIGNAKKEPGDPDFLNLRNARRKAVEQRYALKPHRTLPGGPGWAWARLDHEYQASLKLLRKRGNRIKRPSQGSQDDVRLCFNKPEFRGWQTRRIADLKPLDLVQLLNDVHLARGHRAAEKAAAYVKAALTWALSHRTLESGLAGMMPWWVNIRPPEPTGEEIERMEIRQHELIAAQEACTVEYLGELLAKHEQYCAGRRGNKRVSPGIRWGEWWVALTANRRLTSTKLRRGGLIEDDPRNPYSSPEQPWGIAEWSAELVKSKIPFMLPLPPMAVHIVKSCIWDWELRLRHKRGFRSATEWVFASSRRPRPKGENSDLADPSIYPNSLDAHIRALRGRKKSASNQVDYLEGKPGFWLHLVRSAMTNFVARHPRLSPAAASVMLGHVLPNERNCDWRRMSKTTEEYYLTFQNMDLKAAAMKLWVEALLQAYVNAGGTLPMPAETDPFKPMGPDWILPALPGTEPLQRRRAGHAPRRGPPKRPSKHHVSRRRPRVAAWAQT